MLKWYEAPSASTPRLAPVILIPISLERDSVSGPFRIRRTDQEPLMNMTLVEKLSNDFGIELPRFKELPQDGAGIDVDGVLRAVLKSIKDVERFDLVWEATIAIYEFKKFMLWLDLTANTEKLLKSDVVRHILEDDETSFPVVAPFPRPEELDRRRPAHEGLSVVEADSSQLAAVFAALDGNSFVLQGPPGTGKSQTITNMIAQLLARGKTVLFVSEKRAALEVVEARLKQTGLGPFALEVHSDQTSRKEIVRRLEEPLNYAWSEAPEDWEAHAGRLQTERRALNDYAQAIHEPGPFGESLFQSLSQVIGLREAPQIRLELESPPDHESYLGMKRSVEELVAATNSCRRRTFSALRWMRIWRRRTWWSSRVSSTRPWFPAFRS